MHGSQAELGDTDARAKRAAAARPGLPFVILTLVLTAGAVAGLIALATVEIAAWAKIAILFAILAPAGVLIMVGLRRRGVLLGVASEGRSRLLRRAADAVDEPRAVMGPAGETLHANAAFIE